MTGAVGLSGLVSAWCTPPRVCVSRYHQEEDAYIAAEGNHISDPVENVHLRIREPDPRRSSRLSPPTSAVSVRSSRCCVIVFW
jgi:hypothetical protein